MKLNTPSRDSVCDVWVVGMAVALALAGPFTLNWDATGMEPIPAPFKTALPFACTTASFYLTGQYLYGRQSSEHRGLYMPVLFMTVALFVWDFFKALL